MPHRCPHCHTTFLHTDQRQGNCPTCRAEWNTNENAGAPVFDESGALTTFAVLLVMEFLLCYFFVRCFIPVPLLIIDCSLILFGCMFIAALITVSNAKALRAGVILMAVPTLFLGSMLILRASALGHAWR